MLRKPNKKEDTRGQSTLAVRIRTKLGGLNRNRGKKSVSELENKSYIVQDSASVKSLEKQDIAPPTVHPAGNVLAPPEKDAGTISIDPIQLFHTCLRCNHTEVSSLHHIDASPDFTCRACGPPLLRLPIELIQHVASYLDTAPRWLLRLSCRRLYDSIPTTLNPKYADEAVIFMLQLRNFILPHLEYCHECNHYHAWNKGIWYWWEPQQQQRCRRAAMADGLASFRGGNLGAGYFVCGYCNTRRRYRHCELCMKCELCTGPDHVAGPADKFYCRECSRKKVRCCEGSVLARKACHGCGRCARCTKQRFGGSGEATYCGFCAQGRGGG